MLALDFLVALEAFRNWMWQETDFESLSTRFLRRERRQHFRGWGTGSQLAKPIPQALIENLGHSEAQKLISSFRNISCCSPTATWQQRRWMAWGSFLHSNCMGGTKRAASTNWGWWVESIFFNRGLHCILNHLSPAKVREYVVINPFLNEMLQLSIWKSITGITSNIDLRPMD
jgi:hypothetical protein